MLTRIDRRNLRNGLLFIMPWIAGFVLLQIYPICYSFYLSVTEYSGFGTPRFSGLSNFREMFQDPILLTTVKNTLYYTALSVPAGIAVAVILALCMNQKVREVSVYRAILYLPSILPAFALVFVWILFTNPQYGLMNRLFTALGLPFIDWIGDPRFTKPSLVILAQYGAGGARGGTVGSQNSLFFYVLYIFQSAFKYSRMGYAACLSVMFFAVSVVIAMIVFRWGRSWVNYDV